VPAQTTAGRAPSTQRDVLMAVATTPTKGMAVTATPAAGGAAAGIHGSVHADADAVPTTATATNGSTLPAPAASCAATNTTDLAGTVLKHGQPAELRVPVSAAAAAPHGIPAAAPQALQVAGMAVQAATAASHVTASGGTATGTSTASPAASHPAGAAGAAGSAGNSSASKPAKSSSLPAGLLINIELQTQQAPGKYTSIGSATVEVQKQLGKGGLADVYLVHLCSYRLAAGPPSWTLKGLQQPQQVVIKVVRRPRPLRSPETTEAAAQAFVNSARSHVWDEHSVLDKLQSSSYVIQDYGYGSAAAADGRALYGYTCGIPCLLLEWAELGSVWGKLVPRKGESKPMSPVETWHVMCCMLFALKNCHEQGYLYRDLKPHNVLMVRDGSGLVRYKLADFDIAVPEPRACEEHPNNGELGTRAMLPPEPKWRAESDTWLLGMLLVCCRGGGPPLFRSYQELRQSESYSHLLEEEWQLLELCLRPDRDHRPSPAKLTEHTRYFHGLS